MADYAVTFARSARKELEALDATLNQLLERPARSSLLEPSRTPLPSSGPTLTLPPVRSH
jgi:hypothetical protein